MGNGPIMKYRYNHHYFDKIFDSISSSLEISPTLFASQNFVYENNDDDDDSDGIVLPTTIIDFDSTSVERLFVSEREAQEEEEIRIKILASNHEESRLRSSMLRKPIPRRRLTEEKKKPITS